MLSLKSLVRKSSTFSKVGMAGPPMLSITTAVGGLVDDVESAGDAEVVVALAVVAAVAKGAVCVEDEGDCCVGDDATVVVVKRRLRMPPLILKSRGIAALAARRWKAARIDDMLREDLLPTGPSSARLTKDEGDAR